MKFPLEGATWEKLILIWPQGDNLKTENKLEEQLGISFIINF